MSKGVLIFGHGKVATCIYNTFSKTHNIKAFVVDDEYFTSETNQNIPCIPLTQAASEYPPQSCEFIIGVGYQKVNRTRQNIDLRIRELGYDMTNLIHNSVDKTKILQIGSNNVIFENVVFQDTNFIGDGNIVWSNAVVGHETKINDYNWIASGTVISGNVEVMSFCFFGVNSSTKHGITVSNSTFLGANSYLGENSGENSSWASPNAKMLKIDSDRIIDYMES